MCCTWYMGCATTDHFHLSFRQRGRRLYDSPLRRQQLFKAPLHFPLICQNRFLRRRQVHLHNMHKGRMCIWTNTYTFYILSPCSSVTVCAPNQNERHRTRPFHLPLPNWILTSSHGEWPLAHNRQDYQHSPSSCLWVPLPENGWPISVNMLTSPPRNSRHGEPAGRTFA